MDFDFDQISDMLGSMSEDDMQSLQDAAQQLFGAFGEAGDEPHDGFDEGLGGGFDGGLGGITPEMLAKISQLMGRMNSRDSRTDLIMALKPHLSRRRQHRAEQAVQMMRMMEMLPTLQDAMK